ncbi:unnamed protein product [Blepharisma stoltei]|uniref:Uncharacterized protein n=1 Tax=Blepharisma stoltei TaxID=1481888 RepID=A0AAU9JIZ4_9CILI|nr:unnamed protein product [Blepharisma stoltei]
MTSNIPDLSNASTAISGTLSDVKKQRRQLQQDANLLSNRIKLLQMEEERTWKKIEEAKKRKIQIEEIKKRKENQLKERESIRMIREQNRIKAQEQIQKLKFHRSIGKEKRKEELWSDKKVAYKSGREWREFSMKQKRDIINSIREENHQNALKIKVEENHHKIKIKKREEIRGEENKEDYLRRIKQEEAAKKELEQKVMEMELLEMELIRRLQHTQLIQKDAISELESAISKKQSSSVTDR